MSAHSHSTRTTNRLLAALPDGEYERISADLVSEPLKPRRMLQQRDEPLHVVYFPDRGSLCSLVMPMPDGATAEIALVGSEGLIGVEAALGLRQAMCDATVHVPTSNGAHAMSVDAFRRELDRHGEFYARVTAYVQVLMGVLTQSIACNGLHSAEARCCRWLLHAQDRLETATIPLTHDQLAAMLGVRRPTVSIVVEGLVQNGVVSTERGLVRIDDRDALALRSCECYTTVQKSFDRLMPFGTGTGNAVQNSPHVHAALA